MPEKPDAGCARPSPRFFRSLNAHGNDDARFPIEKEDSLCHALAKAQVSRTGS